MSDSREHAAQPSPDDGADAMMDRNLRSVGEHVPLPDPTTAADLGRWKQASEQPDLTIHTPVDSTGEGVRSMRFRQLITFAGAGSAIAAVIALSFVMLGPTGSSRVEASAIFQSLEEAIGNAFSMTLEDISSEGMVANGAFVASFLEAEDGEQDAVQAHVDFHVRGSEDSEEHAGMDIQVNGAVAPDSQWLYLRMAGLPPAAVANNPIVGMLQQFSANGLLVDLTGLAESMQDNDGPPPWLIDLQEEGESGDATDEEDAENVEDGGSTNGFNYSFTFGDEPPPISGGNSNMTFGLGMSSHTETQVASAPADGEPSAYSSSSSAVDFGDGEGSDLIAALLSGEASAEQIQQLIDMIESAAGETSVQLQEDGSHLLTATDFTFESEGNEPQPEWLDEMVVQVSYVEDQGVRWALIDHIGDANGSIRIDLVDVALDPEQLDQSNFIEEGVTTVWDLSNIGSLVQMLAG